VPDFAAMLLGAAGFTAMLIGHLIVANPIFTGESIGTGTFFNTLLIAYLLPGLLCVVAFWMARGRRHPDYVRLAAVSALAMLFAYVTLEVKAVFQGAVLVPEALSDAETYAYSAVWLLFGLALLLAGLRWRVPLLRYASMPFMILAVLKVFIFDMSALTGFLRALSFLGLGLALLGVGYLYQRIVLKQRGTTQASAAGSE
ncbi:MAG: DUF2339 domain-containing protein, partial [Hyphomicrobiaceae bacterium]